MGVVYNYGEVERLAYQYADNLGLIGNERNAFAHVFGSAYVAYEHSLGGGAFGAAFGAENGRVFTFVAEAKDSIVYGFRYFDDVADPGKAEMFLETLGMVR